MHREGINYPRFKDQFAAMDFEAEPMPVLSLFPMPGATPLDDWKVLLMDAKGQRRSVRGADLGALPRVRQKSLLVRQIFNWVERPEVDGVRLVELLTAAELFDASPAGAEYTDIFLKNPAFTNLPRKFNVTITGCLENCTHSESQDIAMTPAVRDSDGTSGFNVAIGGKMGSGGMTVAQPLDVFAPPHEAGRLAAEITLLFRDEGARGPRTKARLAFLVQEWGVERLRAKLEERWGAPLARAGRDARSDKRTDHRACSRRDRTGCTAWGCAFLRAASRAGAFRRWRTWRTGTGRARFA